MCLYFFIYIYQEKSSSYHTVASDVGTNQLFLPSDNISSQSYMNNISEWTENNKMQLNERKTKLMVFNYTKNHQFATRINLNGTLLETISETTLLGTVISSDLTWHKNTELLTKKGYQRMTILRNLYQFDIPQEDLVMIYAQYIRSILEYNSNVWFSNLTEEEKDDIERVQRVALKIIMQEKYICYEQALKNLNLDTLQERRLMLAERFAKKCPKSEKFQNLFPKNEKDGLNL